MTGSRCVEAFGLWRPEGSLQPCGRIRTRYSTRLDLEGAVKRADVVIGAVLLDISIDQGGCFQDSRPTTHDEPTFRVHDTVFYCVANMPGAVPRTSTYALTNAAMPYVLKLADHRWRAACRADAALANGLSTHEGALLSDEVAADLGLVYTDPASLLT